MGSRYVCEEGGHRHVLCNCRYILSSVANAMNTTKPKLFFSWRQLMRIMNFIRFLRCRMSGIKWHISVTTSAYFSQYIFSNELPESVCCYLRHELFLLLLAKAGYSLFLPWSSPPSSSFYGNISNDFPHLANGNRNVISTKATWGGLNEKEM